MPDPQPVPINAKFDDDFVTQLVVVLNTDTMREVAAKVAQHVADAEINCERPCGKPLFADSNNGKLRVGTNQEPSASWLPKRKQIPRR